MKILFHIGLAIVVSIILMCCSPSYSTDNIRIADDIIYNKERKDILDYKGGRYEIPPEVVGYCKINDIILVKWKPKFPLDAIYDKYDYTAWLYSQDSLSFLYWSIELKEEKQIGPMDSNAFDQFCCSRRIPPCPF